MGAAKPTDSSTAIAELAQSLNRAQTLVSTLRAEITQEKAVESDRIKSEFIALTKAWQLERGASSNMVKMHLLPSYQRIIGMGPAVLPFILEEMQRKPDFWFWALRAITGENPVPNQHAGDLLAMTEDWLKWAREKGIAVVERH